ncbi:hemolysin XhlA family protein [Ectobacillus funiculus]|uniref:hemolysin XhlA family protein n=1 Tax=Ectobacillus funiculus TaxID=137993 RepID=UPI00101DC6E2|nr:hemolysin XhlA family protein [Ectobacillus funiculus]
MEGNECRKEEIKQFNEEQKSLYRDVRSLETKVLLNERDINEIKGEIQGIKSNTTWILRVIIGAVITYILSVLFRGGL